MQKNKRMRVFAGPNGSGKSTLIKKLQADFPQLELIRNSLGDKQDFEKWWPEILDKEQDGLIPLHDRFFYSELVYGPVIRGRINAGEVLLGNVLWFLRCGSFLVYARPHSDVLRETIKVNVQMEGVIEQFQKLLEFYDEVMMAEKNWYTNRFFHYDFNIANSYEQISTQIRRYVNGELG